MSKVWQEWYCTKSGGGCGGYILVKLNTAINGVVTMVCPKCGHKHFRTIKDGQIYEQGRFSSESKEEICPTMAAWSKKPHTKVMKKNAGSFKERDGVVITEASCLLQQSWFEKFGGT